MSGFTSFNAFEVALEQSGCAELTTLEFYKELFCYTRSYLRYGVRLEVPVTLSEANEGEGTWRSVALCDVEDFVSDRNDAYISACTFFPRKGNDGRFHSRNGGDFADELCAFVLDLDHGGTHSLSSALFDWWPNELIPEPTYVVCSGSGLHLYYVLEEPVEMRKRWDEELAHINRYLYSLYANPIFDLDFDERGDRFFPSLGDIDRHGLTQPYRVPGSLDKKGERVVSVWKVGNPISISDLAEQSGLAQTRFTVDDFDMSESLKSQRWERNRAAAEKKKGENPEACGKKKRIGWNPGFYAWLLGNERDRSRLYGEYGHRYKQVVALSVAAVKDRIPRHQLESDVKTLHEAWNLCARRNGIPEIKWEECKKAMKMYDRQQRKDVRKFPKWWLEEMCGFKFGTQKRNGRSQREHLDKVNEDKRRRNRLDAIDKLTLFLRKNPGASKNSASKELHMSPQTVMKYWPDACEYAHVPDSRTGNHCPLETL